MIKIAVFVSGGGTNLQAILDKEKERLLKGEIALVVGSKDNIYALQRAKQANKKSIVISLKNYQTKKEYEDALLDVLNKENIDLIVLAGFLNILSPYFISKYKNRIINVHPSLIPSFCGDGMYGIKVHEAALNYGVKVSGATVHYVNEITDGGEIILQKAVEVKDDDSPESLQQRIMEEAEWIILTQAINIVCEKIKKEKENV